MAEYKSDYLKILAERGFIHQITDDAGLDDALAEGPVTAYIGFDCTAPSLHVGNLVGVMLLYHLQKCGHKPIVLMGTGTTLIGDPSGKDESRLLLTEGEIASNQTSIKDLFERFLTFGDGASDALMVDNSEWLKALGHIDFLRDVGPHFTINRMLTFDSVKLRLDREQPLTFLEFNYMILQSYDFLELWRRQGCRLQMGGSDQWGNIVNGMELARRIDGASLFGLTSPLITTADGSKMGKTTRGAVWLNESALSNHDYYQFWRNAEDPDVARFLRLFTDLPLEEIARLEALEGAEINQAKKILAYEATKLCRGEEAARGAEATAKETFEAGKMGEDLSSFEISAEQYNAGFTFVEAFLATGLSASKKEARRLIEQGGARINGDVIGAVDAALEKTHFNEDGAARLSAGKKRHAVLKLG